MIVIGIVVTTFLYFNSFYQDNIKKERSYLIEAADNFKLSVDAIDSRDNLESLFESFNSSDKFHYFYLTKDGKILFKDNKALEDLKLEASTIEQILDGIASLTLYNRNEGKDYILESRSISNGDKLVVSKLASNPISIFYNAAPGIIGLLVFGFFVALFITEKTVDDFIGAIEEQAIDTSSESLEITSKYKELYPFIRIIKDQKEDINNHILQMERYGETLEAIISNMREGMILLDKDMNILTINESAIKLGDIDYYGVNYDGINLKGLLRSDELDQVFDYVKKDPNKSFSFDASLNNKIINVIVSPVINGGENLGFVIFLVDETKQKLLEAQRKEFSANVSHELKTPLTSINGYAEMMMNGFVKSEDMVRFSGIIYNEGQNLLNMIDDIIKISKLDEGNQALELEDVNIAELIEEIVTTLDYKVDSKDINVDLDLIKNKTYLFNKQILKELLMNLISNGIKYNNQGGKLSILQKEIGPDNLELRIIDTGIGISESDQERIFERFYTVDKSHNKKDSSGLGLSIVKHIVKLMGGNIQVRSQLGQGSEFIINLPINKKE